MLVGDRLNFSGSASQIIRGWSCRGSMQNLKEKIRVPTGTEKCYIMALLGNHDCVKWRF